MPWLKRLPAKPANWMTAASGIRPSCKQPQRTFAPRLATLLGPQGSKTDSHNCGARSTYGQLQRVGVTADYTPAASQEYVCSLAALEQLGVRPSWHNSGSALGSKAPARHLCYAHPCSRTSQISMGLR
jgi:hypothetical protein